MQLQQQVMQQAMFVGGGAMQSGFADGGQGGYGGGYMLPAQGVTILQEPAMQPAGFAHAQAPQGQQVAMGALQPLPQYQQPANALYWQGGA